MTCEEFTEQLDAYELGILDAPARGACEAHLAECAACRHALAEARATDEALRSALAWAEPSPGFADGVVRRLEPQVSWRRWVAAGVAAAVAACLAIALLRLSGRAPQPRPPRPAAPVATPPAGVEQRLVVGTAVDGYGLPARRLVRGRPYAAVEPAALAVDGDSLLVMAGGSQFARAEGVGDDDAVSLLAGSMLGQVGSGGKGLAVELAPELGGAIVRARGCEFYSAGFPADRLASGMAIPADALATWPDDIRIHVFTGRLELDLGSRKLALDEGDSVVISGGACAGTARAMEQRAQALRVALGGELLGKRERYRALRDGYARRLLELRSAQGARGLPYLQERLALVDYLLRSHSAALARIEADHPELFELDAALSELDRLERVRREANDALECFLGLLASAE